MDKWVMSHIWMIYATHSNEWVIPHTRWTSHGVTATRARGRWRRDVERMQKRMHSSMTWLYYVCVIWHIHTCEAFKKRCRAQIIENAFFTIWLYHMCDMTHSYVQGHQEEMSHTCNTECILQRHDSVICVTWLYFLYVSWLNDMCDMTHSHVQRHTQQERRWRQHDSSVSMMLPCIWTDSMCDATIYVKWRTSTCNITVGAAYQWVMARHASDRKWRVLECEMIERLYQSFHAWRHSRVASCH